MNPRSHGRLRLSSADPLAAPRIGLGFDGHPEDLRALAYGVRLSWKVARSASVAAASLCIAGLDEATIGSDTALRDYVLAYGPEAMANRPPVPMT